jgi:anti-anti-sigma factor
MPTTAMPLKRMYQPVIDLPPGVPRTTIGSSTSGPAVMGQWGGNNSLALIAGNDVVRLTLTDEVLHAECLRAAVGLLDGPIPHVTHLDLGAVRWPTAEGLGVLVTLSKDLRARGGRFARCNVTAEVCEVFEVTGLVGVLDVRAA